MTTIHPIHGLDPDDPPGIPLPLFARIARDMRARILDGTYSVHQQLPSEAELTRHFGVSRVTVRQALAQLQKQGLIFKINGKGTFVAKPKASLDVTRLRGFGEAMGQLGHETFARVMSIATVPAEETVADQLGLRPGTPATCLQRLRYLNREPISLDVTYVGTAIGERLARADLESGDLIAVLENDCELALGGARVSIESQLAEPELGGQLGLSEGGPILRIERCIRDTRGAPVLYENLFYRGDAFRYSFEVSRASHPHNPDRDPS